MPSTRRRGFTLVELLVVITIISMLMAMLLPAVTAATESARRNDCMNNMRQLALATRSFEAAFGRFPGYQQEVGPNEATWVVTLFPYMSQQPLYDSWLEADPTVIALDSLVCLSDPPDNSSWPSLSYVANAGLNEFANNAVENGVFHDLLSADPRTRMTVDHIRDGEPNTLLFSENIQATYWTGTEDPTETDLPEPPEGKEQTVFVWHDVEDTLSDVTLRINGNKTPDPSVDIFDGTGTGTFARPSSYHPGGVVGAFADTHVGYIGENIDYKVYVALMTPFGKECDHSSQEFRDYILSAADLQ